MAEKKLQDAEQLALNYQSAKQTLELLQAKYEIADGKYKDRLHLTQFLQTEIDLLTVNKQQVNQLEIELSDGLNIHDSLQKELAKAKDSYEKAYHLREKTYAYQEFITLENSVIKIEQDMAHLRQLEQEIITIKEKLVLIQIDESIINDFRKIDKEIALLQVKLDTKATRLQFIIASDDHITLDKQLLTKTGEQLITHSTELHLNHSVIKIIPGGEQLENLNLQRIKLTEELTQLFAQYCIQSISEAEIQLSYKVALHHEIKLLKNQIKIIAPQGIELLQEQVNIHTMHKNNLLLKIGLTNPSSINDAENRVQHCKEIYENYQQKERKWYEVLTIKKEELRQSNEQFLKITQQAAAQEQHIKKIRESTSDEQLRLTTVKLREEMDNADRKLTEIINQLKAHDWQGLQLEVSRRRIAFETTQQKLINLKANIHDLELELIAVGQRGLAEEKELAEHELTQTKVEFTRLNEEAGSLNLLCKIIKEELQKAKDLVLKPLTGALKPYLNILFPRTEPIINDSFCLQNILRNGIQETFENLSLGTREQLTLLIRLAYADLLAANGNPTMLLLDDALVNTDDERREKMKEILYRAAQNYQIILLTCHGNAYRDCGGSLYEI